MQAYTFTIYVYIIHVLCRIAWKLSDWLRFMNVKIQVHLHGKQRNEFSRGGQAVVI